MELTGEPPVAMSNRFIWRAKSYLGLMGWVLLPLFKQGGGD